MAYRCSSCTYASDRKSHLLRHLSKRGNPCQRMEDAEIAKMAEAASFKCRREGCEMSFKQQQSRTRHERVCEHGVSPSTPKSGVNQYLNIANSPISGHHNTMSVNNSPTHVNVTVNINGFDQFTPTEIDAKRFVSLMTQGSTNVVLKCLEDQQFNTDQPENMNVFISNLKDRIARVYDGSRWSARKGEEVVDDVLEKYSDMINSVIDEFENDESVYQKARSSVTKWKRSTGKEEFEIYAKERITMLLYNLRSIVKEMHNVKQR